MRESLFVARRRRLSSTAPRAWTALASLTAALVTLGGCSDTGDNTSVGSGMDAASAADVTTLLDSSSTPDASPAADSAVDAAADAPAIVDATVDGGSDATTDAAHDATGDAPIGDAAHDATTDAQADAAIDAAVDAAPEAGRLPDGGCQPTDMQCLCDTFIQTSENSLSDGGGDAGTPNTPQSTCTATEVVLFEVDPTGACLDCALNAGQCADNPALGNDGYDCEDPYTGVGASETAGECLAVLACDLGVNPAAAASPVSLNGPGPVEGYCGTTPVGACTNGTTPPNGACQNQIVAGFPATFTGSNIGSSITDKRYASGRAGQIAGCGQSTCFQCLR
jgi:hypothetical protein